jgi:predicted AlkP superfamily phosphohydrolase/phosphomutase/Flp pilus assembly protein TadD
MKRPIITFVVVAAALLALFLTFGVKRIPDGHEAVRVGRDGELAVLEPGMRLLLPGSRDFIVYPTGEHTYRSPSSGTHEILTQEGESVAVAFELTVSIPKGSAARLYERFSEDFAAAVDRVVTAAAETEGATTSVAGDPDRYLERVTSSVRDQFREVGVSLTAMSLDFWGGEEEAADYPEEVDVSDEPPRRLVVIGVDGGDWLNIEPLVDAGKLPNFKKLIEDGATGPLRSEEPILSPLLWTTMATGKYPEEHGILNFTIADPETGAKAPITRHYRQVDAWWNMLGDYGRTVAVAGWLATDPAETVNGVLVTDKLGYLAFAPAGEGGDVPEGSVYPRERTDEIARSIVRARDLTYEAVEPFMHIPREEFLAHRDAEFDPKDSINAQLLLLATTRTYENIALHLLRSDRPDVLAVYFELVDATSHLFMLYAPPRMDDVPEAEYERYKDAVERAYIAQDEILGRFMQALGDDTVLMVISDHGFKAGESRLKNRPEIWAGNAANWHRLNGIVAFYGAGVKRGFEIRGASILDVTPTILAIQGLPRASDMPGKILAQAFEADLQQRFNPNTVATLERRRAHELGPKTSGAASEEAMKKLEALGYLTPDNADAHNNLGQRYQQRGEYLKAIEEYKKAIAMRPGFHSAYNNIAVCYGKLERYDEAEAALLKTIDIKPDDFYAMNNLAVMSAERGRLDHAVQYARMCVSTEPGYVNGRITLGSVLAMTGDLDGAENEFREALRLDPENRSAQTNLERLEQARSQKRN